METFPDPRMYRTKVRFVGVPLILCDEIGVSTLVHRFGRVELGSVSLAEGGELMAMEVVL